MMISISTNNRKRRIRRRDMMISSQTSFHAPYISIMILLALLLSANIIIPSTVVSAKEIVATNEWQLLKENDTIPSGLHVRMDLSTGEKWVKLVTDDDQDEEYDTNNKGVLYDDNDSGSSKGVQSAVMDVNGALSIVEESSTTQADDKNNNKDIEEYTEEDASSTSTTGKKDYNMMHRVMSKLPPEELEKYGGLPSLPELSSSSNTSSSRIDNLTPPQRLHFEQRMEEIWNKRQIELQNNMNDNVADLPSILKLRIDVMKEYISNSYESLSDILVERRKKKTAETDVLDGEEDKEGDEVSEVADNIITALQDLEYQLSDVDMSRDFHTLGGWGYLVALLDDSVHTLSVQEGEKDNEEMAILVDEIQALAAMTIGTAVSNCGEFHVWALEDVSSVLDTIRIKDEQQQPSSALSLLISSFENELTLRTQNMGDGSSTMAIPTQSNAKYKSRATYKLRAIYALGSILRGNPIAQQNFVQNNGPNILVQNVLGTLSNVRGPIIMNDVSLVKLDYKFASKVLALGQDVVMDVVLHEDAYNQEEEESTTLTASQLVGSFTTEQWCDLSLRMLVPPTEKVGSVASRGMKERAVHATRALAPGCSVHQSDTVSTSWGVEEVKEVRSEWNREGSDDGIDSVYRKELLDLVDSVLDVLIDEQ